VQGPVAAQQAGVSEAPPPTNTAIRNAVKMAVGSMWFGDLQWIGMC